jgi:hypothetical protein
MTSRKSILFQIVFLFLVLVVTLFIAKGYVLQDLLDVSVLLVLLLFPAACVIISLVCSFFFSALIKGQFNKVYFRKWLSMTLLPSMFLGLFFIYKLQQGWNDRQSTINSKHNARYRHVYGDERDILIGKAIDRVCNRFTDKTPIRIKRMRVVDLDSIQGNSIKGNLEVQLIYCLGKSCKDKSTFASRQCIKGNKIEDLFVKEPITEGVGLKQYNEIENLLRLRTKDLEQQEAVAIAMLIAKDLIIIKE